MKEIMPGIGDGTGRCTMEYPYHETPLLTTEKVWFTISVLIWQALATFEFLKYPTSQPSLHYQFKSSHRENSASY